ncbi:MAG: hypothetical protein AAFQ41_15230 [Cyanobacteria bacterium J06623_7]
MFSWSNLFNLQNCQLNNLMVNWLGVEKEGLVPECDRQLSMTRTAAKSGIYTCRKNSYYYRDSLKQPKR